MTITSRGISDQSTRATVEQLVQAQGCAQNMTDAPVVVVDNGASTIKAGIAIADEEPRYVLQIYITVGDHADQMARLITNALVRSKGDKTTYFGHEFERCKDYSSLHFRLPFEKVSNDKSNLHCGCLEVGQNTTNSAPPHGIPDDFTIHDRNGMCEAEPRIDYEGAFCRGLAGL